jgi:ferrous iron transport protein B
MADKNITIAICSIPNTGKSTLFNKLTGAHQAVGNWAGVSVEKKTGHFKLNGYNINLIDLPGAYSITPTSIEETVVRDYLLKTPPDYIINIIDARNMYRSLGLTLQLAQSEIPMVVALNMMDEARRAGLEIDIKKLSNHLGCHVIPIVARTGEGVDYLKNALLGIITDPSGFRPPYISRPPIVEDAIVALAKKIEKIHPDPALNKTFIAERLLESGDLPKDVPVNKEALKEIVKEVKHLRSKTEQSLGQDLTITCAQCRFNSARGLVNETTSETLKVPDKFTNALDRILLNKYAGLPMFFFIMFLLFQGIYALGTPLQALIGDFFSDIQSSLHNTSLFESLPDFAGNLLIDGILNGLGIVISFFPLIAIFFIFMSLIEDSGYMARAAFLLDRLMHSLGLDGKAFINILLGYGCNVPAVMGTRILSSRHNRIVTMLLIPFTLCSARFQVFVFLAAILFAPSVAPWVVFGLYVLSFVMVFVVGFILKLFKFAGKPEPFIMEIPPYRVPTVNTVALRAWMEMKSFLYTASTYIIGGVVLVWLLTNLPAGVEPGSINTWAGQIGQFLQPIFHPIGIGWREVIALIFGFVAKEIVVGSMAVIYGADTATQILASITPLQGISFMVFTLLYTPCIATIAAIKAESASWKITGISLVLGIAIAWVSAFIVYQGGLVLGFH